MPTVIFLDAHGREVPDRVIGAVSAEEMVERLRAVDGACDRRAAPAAGAGAPVTMACAVRW
jgi:thiol:disulfide interchange protein DsbD